MLLDRLPVESEYKTELRNDTDLSALPAPKPGRFGPWPQTDMLLAKLVDLAQHWMWANADPDTRPPAPDPYPRPGVERSNVRAISPAAAAYLEYKRQHQGADPPEDWTPEVG